jgi:hypothetical protein
MEREVSPMRSLLWVAGIAVLGSAACNYTVGECWVRGQGGESEGVGSGAIVPSGAGGLGDTPPEPGGDNGSLACNSSEEPEFGKPADQYIYCRKRGLDAAACSEVCLAAGASCVPLALHPNKGGLEPGRLSYCKNGWPTNVCAYTFANNDTCILFTAVGSSIYWRCVYNGG